MIRTVQYLLKVNIWGCLLVKGFRRVICFHHNLNSSFLCSKIYTNTLLLTARTHFWRGRAWVLVEDNDLKHCSQMSIEWKESIMLQRFRGLLRVRIRIPLRTYGGYSKLKLPARKQKTVKNLQEMK